MKCLPWRCYGWHMTNKTLISLAPGLEIAVISLARHAARGADMQRQAAALGLPLRLFTGFDAGAESEEALSALVPPIGYAGPMPAKDRGCTASHLLLLQSFLAGSASHLLVLEDDVLLEPALLPWLEALSWWPSGADIVRLEAWGDPQRFHVVSRRGHTHLGRDLLRLYSMHPGTAAYLITRASVERAVSWIGRMPVPIDHFLFNPGVSSFAAQANIWQVRPALIRQVLPAGDGIARVAEKRAGLDGLRDQWRRGVQDLGGMPRSLGPMLVGQRRLVRPL